jgi:tRNA A37 threonylcarbamoyladenosine modification protein TsaB
MLELYFSLTSNWLFLALGQNDDCLISVCQENTRLHAENFCDYLRKICEKGHCSLADLKKIYFTSSPGGQTGLRVSLAFLATYQVLNPQVEIYQINTLLLQAGTDNCLSLLTIDSRESKYHLAAYQEKKCLLAPQVISRENLNQFQQQFPNFVLRKDFQEIDFLAN